MIAYELLTANKSLLEHMISLSVDVADVRHLDMYREYLRLSGEGHKKTYIIQYLSDEYGVSDRNIYRVIDKLSATIDL